MRSLLVTQGVVLEKVDRRFPALVERMRRWDGSELGPCLKDELLREFRRWELVDEDLRAVRQQQRDAVRTVGGAKEDASSRQRKLRDVQTLQCLRGIGERSAWPLVHEFLWRDFSNRREVGGAAGLTGTPWNSGDGNREQGISKAGNKRVRRLMVELSWFWLRFQPQSEITLWFNRKFAHGGKRMRRIGIVAMARRLLIALWRYLRQDVIPAGAQLKA
jgi:transposase